MRRGIAIGLVLGSAAQPAHATGQTTFGTELGTPFTSFTYHDWEPFNRPRRIAKDSLSNMINDQRLVEKDGHMITYDNIILMTNMDTDSEAADRVWCNIDRALQDLEHRGTEYIVAPAEHLNFSRLPFFAKGATDQIVASKKALDKLRADECWTRDLVEIRHVRCLDYSEISTDPICPDVSPNASPTSWKLGFRFEVRMGS